MLSYENWIVHLGRYVANRQVIMIKEFIQNTLKKSVVTGILRVKNNGTALFPNGKKLAIVFDLSPDLGEEFHRSFNLFLAKILTSYHT